MTAPVKYTSKGGSFLLSISSVYTAIGAIDSIDGPDPEVETGDVTALDSGTGREKQPTMYTDAGQTNFSLFFDPANTVHKALTAFLSAPAIAAWKLTYPDVAPTSWTWSGILKKFKPSLKVGEFLKADVSIENTGLVTGW